MVDLFERGILRMDDIKAQLDIAQEEDKWDVLLTQLNRGITVAFEVRCSRPFVSQVHAAVKMDGDGTDTIEVPFPLISVDNSGNITNDLITVTTADYVVYNESGRIVLTDGSSWATGRQKITISYTNGWERTELPDDVVLAASMWLEKLFHEMKNKRLGVSSKSHAGESINYVKDIPEEVTTMINARRLRMFS